MEKAVLNDEQLDNVTGGSRITYTVKSGDTLEGIAKQMGIVLTNVALNSGFRLFATSQQACRVERHHGPELPDGRPGAEGQVLIGSLPKRMNAAARGRNPARRIPFI